MRSLPHQALEVPKVHDLRRAAATFTWRTGVEVDGLSPRAFSLLSDEALAQVVYLIWAAETWCRWPTAAMSVHILLLGKPAGGFRPIALLPSLCRLYMKVRAVHLRRWAAEHTRPFFALGQGKCTVDVAARTMVHAEAADRLQGDTIVTALIDI
eukprot:9012151-Pyramimonas_sp.AAC.1